MLAKRFRDDPNEGIECGILVQNTEGSVRLGTVVIGGLYDFNIPMDGMEAIVPARFLFTVEGNGRARAHHRPPFGQDNRECVNPAHLHKSTCAGLRHGC